MKSVILILSILFSSLSLTKTIVPEEKGLNKSSYCTLQLVGLKCITAEGYVTLDAIYFKIDGRQWPNKRLRMGAGDYVDLEGYADIDFSGSIKIELWDDDTWDSDDFLGAHRIDCSYDSDGVLRFAEDGANYKLFYRVK